MGSGAQYVSWIAIDDAIGAIHHAVGAESLHGPVNAVSPAPVTNAEFTRVLARVLSRPAIFPMPAFAARLAFGEMADALLLASARVMPTRLQASGYRFRFPELEGALRHLLVR
jgi:NAD dependent epimerase/dehydratase family enzyme